MAIRSLDVYKIVLVAGQEKAWTPPDGLSVVDIYKDADADVYVSFVSGGARTDGGGESGGARFAVTTDWWNAGGKGMTLSSARTFYFYCATANVVRIVGGVE